MHTDIYLTICSSFAKILSLRIAKQLVVIKLSKPFFSMYALISSTVNRYGLFGFGGCTTRGIGVVITLSNFGTAGYLYFKLILDSVCLNRIGVVGKADGNVTG